MKIKTLDVTAYRIKKLLAETGWGQAGLGERVGVTQQTVQRWASGKTSPTPDNLDKLSEITGHPIYWFLLPPEDSDQAAVSEMITVGPTQLDLLRTFDAFPEEDQEAMLREMKEKKESMDKTVERWIAAQKGKRA